MLRVAPRFLSFSPPSLSREESREGQRVEDFLVHSQNLCVSIYSFVCCFQRWNILKDGNLCRLKIAIIRVTFMYFFFNSKIRISIEISIVSIRDHPHFYIV